jgi:hypothetical protein
MDQKMKKALDAIFEKQEAADKAAARARTTAEEEQAAALKQFLDLRDSVIRPAMEKMHDYLKRRGFDSEIIVEDEGFKTVHGQPTMMPSSIKMKLGPAVRASNAQAPYLMVACDKARARVDFRFSTFSAGAGGESGSSGEAGFDEVTEDLIQRKLLAVIEKIVR